MTEKPELSPNFTVEDIRKFRDYKGEQYVKMTMDEMWADIEQGAAEFHKIMDEAHYVASDDDISLRCPRCKAYLEEKTVAFMVELESCIIVIKNVPTQVCSQCGERLHSNEVANQLESIVNSLRGAVTEVAIVDYPNRVA